VEDAAKSADKAADKATEAVKDAAAKAWKKWNFNFKLFKYFTK